MTRFARAWQGALRRALYEWSMAEALWFACLYAMATAAISGLWYAVGEWQSLDMAAQEQMLQRQTFPHVVLSYITLFTVLNMGAVLCYVTPLASAVAWLGRWGWMESLRFAPAWRLVFFTAWLPLGVVLVFGQAWGVTLPWAVVLGAAHLAWLRGITLPRAEA